MERGSSSGSITIKGLLVFSFLGNFYSPVPMFGSSMFIHQKNFISTNMTSEISEEDLHSYDKLPKSFVALDYLNIANGIVHSNNTSFYNCKDYSQATIDTYHKLIEQNSREDLKKDVRLALETPKEGEGHVWLQVRKESEWVEFEPGYYSPVLNPEEVKEYSDETLRMKIQTFADHPASYVGVSGTNILRPTLYGWSDNINSGGLVGLLLSIKDKTT